MIVSKINKTIIRENTAIKIGWFWTDIIEKKIKN